MRQSKPKTRKTKTRKTKTRKSKSRNRRYRTRGGAAAGGGGGAAAGGGGGAGGGAAVRPIETYRLTDDLRAIIDKTYNILAHDRKIDIKYPDSNIQAIIRLEKDTILYVARKIASVLRNEGLDIDTPIIHYLKHQYVSIINKAGQAHLYTNAAQIDNELNLDNGNNSNAGGSNLHEIFGNEYGEDDIDAEIMEMVNEFNQQPYFARMVQYQVFPKI
jgi:hypothetical protein